MIKKLILSVGLFLLCSGVSMGGKPTCYPGLDCPEDIQSTEKERNNTNIPILSVNHELKYWQETKQCNQSICYQNFLKRYPHGKYANLARSNFKSSKSSKPSKLKDKITTLELKRKLKKISNGEFTIDEIELLLDMRNGSYGHYIKNIGEQSKQLKKYKLIKQEIKKDYVTISLLPLGKKIRGFIVYELLYNINYSKELHPVVNYDKSIKYKYIKSAFNTLSPADIEYFLFNLNFHEAGVKKNTTKEKKYNKFVKIKLLKRMDTDFNGKKNTMYHLYGLTDMGKEIRRIQIVDILNNRLL